MSTYDDAAINRAVRELHEWECSFGADGKACTRGPDSHSPSYHGYVEKVFNSLERAPWWREVGATHVVKAFQRYRIEIDDSSADERTSACDMRVSEIVRGNDRFFVDTRWEPEPEPLKVGDVLETVEDLERLPEGAGVVDGFGDLAQKTVSGDFQFADHDPMSHPPESIIHCGPFTVVHLPKTEATE